LASSVIEQRNSMVSFLNDTISFLQKEIAGLYNQKGLSFRTSPLILCHIDYQSNPGVASLIQDPNNIIGSLTEQLKYFEFLQSSFTGIPQPQKVDDVLST
jgi:hypothetical protein